MHICCRNFVFASFSRNRTKHFSAAAQPTKLPQKSLTGTDIQTVIELMYKDENTPDLGYDGQVAWEEQSECRSGTASRQHPVGQFLFSCECPAFCRFVSLLVRKHPTVQVHCGGAHTKPKQAHESTPNVRRSIVQIKNTWNLASYSRRCAHFTI